MKAHAIASLTLFLCGCAAVGPDYAPPEVDHPDAFGTGEEEGLSPEELAEWWHAFEDPQLEELIETTLLNNFDLIASFERLSESRARYGVARADWLPTIDASGSYARARPLLGPDLVTQDQWAAGGDLAWEIDLFGRIRRSVESAQAVVDASIEDIRGLQVLLIAETAASYLTMRSFQERLEIANRNVESQNASSELATRRYEAGIAAGLDPAQADVNRYSTQATVPALQIGLRRERHRLAVLTGQSPRALDSALAEDKPLPTVPGELLVGIPADLMRNRPDIRAAERILAAQTARVGVATAAQYPAVNLAGSWDWLARTTGDLFGDSLETGSIGPVVSIPIFNGGRLRSNIRAEEAAVRRFDAELRQRLLIAQEEVENSLVAIVEDRRERALLGQAADAAQRSVDLSLQLYTSGQASFQRVLDAERDLFSLEDRVARAKLNVLLDFIELYRSLGGGWAPASEKDPSQS